MCFLRFVCVAIEYLSLSQTVGIYGTSSTGLAVMTAFFFFSMHVYALCSKRNLETLVV